MDNHIRSDTKFESDIPKKKKLKKLSAIIGAAALVFVVLLIAVNVNELQERGEQARKDEEYITAQQQASVVKLPKTYTNETAGISFHYPDEWVILDVKSEFEVVEIIDSKNNADSIASFKVSCILDQNLLWVFTGDEASVREAVNENANFIKFGDAMLGGLFLPRA